MNSGQFTPILGSATQGIFTQVHFFPKNGNKIIINGREETIPNGVGVISGGVIGTYNDALIEESAGQTLAPFTLYYVYVVMSFGKMRLCFSKTKHKEDPNYGNQVHALDPTRSLVGMVYTNAEGKFLGNGRAQLTLSWFNRGHLGLFDRLDNLATSSPTLTELDSVRRLEWLQWGVNDQFQEGFTVPNVCVGGSVVNSNIGSYVQVAIGINGVAPTSYIASHYQQHSMDAGTVYVAHVPGSPEGHSYATCLMGTGGTPGTALITSGSFFSSPHWS